MTTAYEVFLVIILVAAFGGLVYTLFVIYCWICNKLHDRRLKTVQGSYADDGIWGS